MDALKYIGFTEGGWGVGLLFGAAVTILLASCAMVGGIVIGGIGGAIRATRPRSRLGLLFYGYGVFIRGIPELLTIYILFFGSSSTIQRIATVFGYRGYIDISPFLVGVVALSLIAGAYILETMRAAFVAVPAGLIEAGRSIGMRRRQIFTHIAVPLALRVALPALGNIWLMMVKETSLVSVTSLAELLRVSTTAGASTGHYFEFYLIAGVVYLLICVVSARCLLFLDVKLAESGR